MFVEHKEALEVTEAPAKTMKLSEAIRIGARIRPQCAKVLHDGRGSCALGAAIEGHGHDIWDVMALEGKPFDDLIASIHPALRGAGGRNASELWNEIGYRNDCGQTREQIADWLESQGL